MTKSNRESDALKVVKEAIRQLKPSEIAALRPWVLARFDVQGNDGRINKYDEDEPS